MKRLTLAAVNKAIAAAGGAEVLVKGKDYFYFAEGEAHTWPSASVYVYRLNELTLDQWIEEWKSLRSQKW